MNFARSPGPGPYRRAVGVPRNKGNRKGEESQARQECRRTFCTRTLARTFLSPKFRKIEKCVGVGIKAGQHNHAPEAHHTPTSRPL